MYRHLRKGDVILVEGRLRVSQLVKYAAQSQWSHSALYVGDELLHRGGGLRDQALANFGELADRLLIEALTDEGVIAAPVAKYRWHNLRVCRPSGIPPADLERVVDSVIADLGKQYDARNFLDLALMLLSPAKFGALKTWTLRTCLGNCTELQVICSGMIAKAFQRVGYPILPEGRHYSQILPRDFDLSPNFQILKWHIKERGREPADATRAPYRATRVRNRLRSAGVQVRQGTPPRVDEEPRLKREVGER
ncbi:MAG: lipo-like protein [Candidatus Rokubacteria bacterium]|nr:lipo-like protein [Candidatus Rokubacteria bacterium]